MERTDATEELRLHLRPSVAVTLSIPLDLLDEVRAAAAARDMPTEALLKLYLGQGMRRDVVLRCAEDLLAPTAAVLARHIPSEDLRADILREIRGKLGLTLGQDNPAV